MAASSTQKRRGLHLALVLLLTFAVYTPSLFNGFTFDDTMYVMTHRVGRPANVMIQDVRPFSEYFEREYGYEGMKSGGRGFRPTTVYSLAIVHALSKTPDPTKMSGYADAAWLQHLVNVLLHVLSVWLVYHIVGWVSGPGLPPLVGALAFALQPLHTDVVAGIVGRGELLPFVLCGAGLLLYLRAPRLGGFAKQMTLVGAAVCLFFGMCAKESAIAWSVFVPLFAWIVDWRADPERGAGGALVMQLPRIWAVAIPIGLWVVLYLRFLGIINSTFQVPYEFNPLFYSPIAERIPVAVMILGYGISKVFFCKMLAMDYGLAVFPLDVGYGDWRFLLALGFILLILGVGMACIRRHPLVFLTAAAMLGFSFATSNVLVPIETIFGERLYFTPSLGLCFLFAWVAKHLPAGRLSRWLLIGGFAMWCLWGAWWCVERSFAWRGNDSLVVADVEYQPRSLLINRAAAEYYLRSKNQEKWMYYQMRCLELDPHYIMVLNDMGAYHLRRGELDRAREYLDRAERALELRPRYLSSQGDVVYLNLGRYFLLRGERSNALAAFRRARELNVYNPHTRDHLLMLAHEDRDEAMAEQLLREYEQHQPNRPVVGLHRGLQAWRQGDYPRALALLHEAIIQRKAAQGRQYMPAWWVFQDTLGQLGRHVEQARILEDLLAQFPPEERPKLVAELKNVLRKLLITAPAGERPRLEKRLRELSK